MANNFKKDEIYSVREMSDDKFHLAYDYLYAVVDGDMNELAMWHNEEMEYQMKENNVKEEEAWQVALDDILNNIGITYEDSKDIAIFQGIPPVGPGRGFDFYSTYKCLEVISR